MQYALTALLALLLANPLCLCGGVIGHSHTAVHGGSCDGSASAGHAHCHPEDDSCSAGHDEHQRDQDQDTEHEHHGCPCQSDHSDARLISQVANLLPCPPTFPTDEVLLPSSLELLSPDKAFLQSCREQTAELVTGRPGLLQVYCVPGYDARRFFTFAIDISL